VVDAIGQVEARKEKKDESRRPAAAQG